jgi:hypothetical protein
MLLTTLYLAFGLGRFVKAAFLVVLFQCHDSSVMRQVALFLAAYESY